MTGHVRAERARELRSCGMKYADIGKDLGVSAQRARELTFKADWLDLNAEYVAGLRRRLAAATVIDLLALPIECLELSTRAENCLRTHGECETIGDVLRLSRPAMERLPNMGKKSLAEIEQRLAELQNLAQGGK